MSTEKGRAGEAFYRAYLDDQLRGSRSDAVEGYQAALEEGGEAPLLAARAALRLAEIAEGERRRQVALDYALRASVLGAELPAVKGEADAMQRRLARVRAQDIEVRGPPAGTVLAGVSAEVAAQFQEAEALLSVFHGRRVKPRLEELSASIRNRKAAMETAVRAYRRVMESGEKVAEAASEFRIASAYYDYSLSLSFELPQELDAEVRSRLRSSLRSELRELRARARGAYERSLAAADSAGDMAGTWREAAELGLSSVNDLLRGSK